MKRFKFPKIKIKKINTSYLFSYLFSLLITSLILALILISLPLTEKITSTVTYDLKNKNTLYWAKEYIIQLETEDDSDIEKDIIKAKNIFQKRLRKYSVERSQIIDYVEDDTYFLKISIQTSQSNEIVENLIKSPFIIRIVTRRDDVDYENEEDVLAPYLAENYNPTNFTRSSFRNIHVSKLKNSANEYSYFSLFKVWPGQSEWNNFLKENEDTIIGLDVDGFVTPVNIQKGQTLFASPVYTDDEEYAKAMNIMYSAGQMPLKYSVTEEIDIPVDLVEADYIKLTQGILLAILTIYLYLYWINKTSKDILLKSLLVSIITVSTWIAYLKISNTPVDIFLLAIEVVVVIALIRVIVQNKLVRIITTTLLTLLSSIYLLLGTTYVKIFAQDLLLLLILINISYILVDYYLVNVKKSLKL
ncbi:hypothetical protein GX888_00940 [Candidatus Dojkabacteria bacterium]|uniref:Uncharacterized protein n=1 Tax=Candidatus Dojkabacteria bacterium TaxID=2099670 RepID=A0A847VCY0_9BACT|nr:hypothetical protein [Candidatus Dojkabacteria bacterium]